MNYVLSAVRGNERHTVSAATATETLDQVDQLVALGFKIRGVFDDDGNEISTPALMTAYLKEKTEQE